MAVLLEREGLIYYKLSTVYLQSLKASCKIAAATEDSSSCGSTESSLSSTRRRSVNWIFKVSTTHKTHIQSQPPSPNLDSWESWSNLCKISLVKIVINNCCKSLFLCLETLSSSTLSSACQATLRPNNTNSHIVLWHRWNIIIKVLDIFFSLERWQHTINIVFFCHFCFGVQ